MVRRYGVLLLVGLAYYVFVSLTNIGIPCPVRLLTGFQCPGCGISRMLVSLVRLDLAAAFHYNPVVFLTLPIVLFCVIRSDIDYIRTGKSSSARYQPIWIAELVVLLIFGVVRNIV